MLLFADMYNTAYLKTKCGEFIGANSEAVFKTGPYLELIKSRPEMVITVLQNSLLKMTQGGDECGDYPNKRARTASHSSEKDDSDGEEENAPEHSHSEDEEDRNDPDHDDSDQSDLYD